MFKKTQEKREKWNKESKINLKCLKYALRKIKETYVIAVHEQTTNHGFQKNTEIYKYYVCVYSKQL